jgi:hypothetical protein
MILSEEDLNNLGIRFRRYYRDNMFSAVVSGTTSYFQENSDGTYRVYQELPFHHRCEA